jgi:hypothetical protein
MPGKHSREVFTDSPSLALGGDDVDFVQEIKNIVHGEMAHFLADVEYRLAQTYEVERRTRDMVETGTVQAPERVYAEDLSIGQHILTGYTVTANSPAAGSIAWASLHVVYNGVDYTCADGSTANKYVWFVKPASGTAVTLNTGNAKPSLNTGDSLIWFNNAGTPINVVEATLPPVVGDNAVDGGAIQQGAVSPTHTTFYTSLNNAIAAAQTSANNAQATADGAIVTYFQNPAPWPDGDTTQAASKVGDVWYDSATGYAYRWSGPSGTPTPNHWALIEDSNITQALNAANAAQTTANSKITTFYAASTAVPSAVSIGDFWVVTDKDNLLRRATATGTGNWVDLPAGSQAIANGAIKDVHVGSGISGAKIAGGTITDAQIGGVSGAKIAAGTVSSGALGAGAVTAPKLSTFQHILY